MIPIKSSQEIEIMKEGGKILSSVLNMLVFKVKPGVGTKELDEIAEDEIRLAGGFPIFKGYHGFPTTLCTCINSEIVHAPAKPNRILQDGDILSIDLGMRYPAKGGMITDMAITVPVGKVSKQAKKIISVTQKCLELAIIEIKSGVNLNNLSLQIQNYAEKNNFNVVRDLSGHGVGKKLHEEPQILNYGEKNSGSVLQSGMTLAIEPMLVAGDYKIILDKDKQTYKTKDGKLSAHFEHTVLVTEKGAKILTES